MEKRSEKISHSGKIVEITPEVTRVTIVSESACSSCHARSLCGMADGKVKEIEVRTDAWAARKVGDEVNVVMTATMGRKAVTIGYVLPLVLMVAVLMGCLAAGVGELVSGLSAIAAVALYYLVLKLFSSRLKNSWEFRIE